MYSAGTLTVNRGAEGTLSERGRSW